MDLQQKNTWLVTGAAGFIGSHLVEQLLQKNQTVIGLDDLSACGTINLDIIKTTLPTAQHDNFTFIKGDIRNKEICKQACQGADYILHHAAIGSVPRSFEDPSYVDGINVGGFLNMMEAAANNSIKKFIYASSSAVYGDYTDKPNQEDQPLKPLSPYAVGKYANEHYAESLSEHYGMQSIGLRYFNIYGSRQDPNGAYAAVIPKWIEAMQNNADIHVFGNGEAIRDFCFVEDVVNANISAALCHQEEAHDVYNIASGETTSLNSLFDILRENIQYTKQAEYKPDRHGDIKISCARIDKAKQGLSYNPQHELKEVLQNIIAQYKQAKC